MAPWEIKEQILKQLRATRSAMLSARWLLRLETEDEDVQLEAARSFLRVNHAIRKLENEQLGDIRDRLLENEEALNSARQQLETALSTINRVRNVLDTVASFLGVVARVATLLA